MLNTYATTENGDLIPLTQIASDALVGLGTTIYAYTTIEENVTIGDNCVVGANCFVGAGASLGDGTRVQSGAFICRQAKIGKGVFIGPLAILTDDKHPKAGNKNYTAEPPILEDGCSIGAGAIILPGVRIGAGAMVGAGAVVSKDVAPGQTVIKVPAVTVPSMFKYGGSSGGSSEFQTGIVEPVVYTPTEREGFGM